MFLLTIEFGVAAQTSMFGSLFLSLYHLINMLTRSADTTQNPNVAASKHIYN